MRKRRNTSGNSLSKSALWARKRNWGKHMLLGMIALAGNMIKDNYLTAWEKSKLEEANAALRVIKKSWEHNNYFSKRTYMETDK